MTGEWGRALCADPAWADSHEWLVTNGTGAFAAGTISGEHRRRYHGLLFAAERPPLGRVLFWSRAEERILSPGGDIELGRNRWGDGSVSPDGCHLERFELRGRTPVWTFRIGRSRLERSLGMVRGAQQTRIRWRHVDGPGLSMAVRVLVQDRPFHSVGGSRGGFAVSAESGVCKVSLPGDGRPTLGFWASRGRWETRGHWHIGLHYAEEAARGLDCREDLWNPADLFVDLKAGEGLELVGGTGLAPVPVASPQRERRLKILAGLSPERKGPWEQLSLAADDFLAYRRGPSTLQPTLMAGYPWFGDWGRDTMICVPGLAQGAGRPGLARRMLEAWSRHVRQGLLPNHFPEDGGRPPDHSVDAPLWFIEAVRAVHAAQPKLDWLRRVFPAVEQILASFAEGTQHGICRDPEDGLLACGTQGLQLTWMDAKVGDWVVTPRRGKPVEVNALWYNALCAAGKMATDLGRPGNSYVQLAREARRGFERYAKVEGGLLDVLDGNEYEARQIRPNQIFAVSVFHSPLDVEGQRSVVAACLPLWTPAGLRSLNPDSVAYRARYEGGVWERDGAYHQGTVWAWLAGPMALAYARAYDDINGARALLLPLLEELERGCLGQLGEINDGQAPYHPRGAFAQAWSVFETLRAARLLGLLPIRAIPGADKAVVRKDRPSNQ